MLMDVLTGVFDLLLVVLGFSLIIVIHEAGHFFAARWAGIRVLAFAVGFGPALVSYRKGMGLRRGSSEHDYRRLVGDGPSDRTGTVGAVRQEWSSGISPTEYRLNCLPFGGYVKMLGQDDADPTATSTEPDSYQNCPPFKRMVVISAGVIANLLTAALAFIIVFNIGLMSEPPVVGGVDPTSPAASAVASNAPALGVTDAGLQPGDRVLSVDGHPVPHFNDVRFRVAFAPPATPVSVVVSRPGVASPLEFSILPKPSTGERLLSIGIDPMASTSLPTLHSSRNRAAFAKMMDDLGLAGVESGMTLVDIDGKPVSSALDVEKLVARSNGAPVKVGFINETHGRKEVTVAPTPEFQSRTAKLPDGAMISSTHLLGLSPVLSVRTVVPGTSADKFGLKPGDVFSRLGSAEFPGIQSGIAAVRQHKGGTIRVGVLRPSTTSPTGFAEQDLGDVPVTNEGTIGFTWKDSASIAPFVSAWTGAGDAFSGSSLPIPGGSSIVAVDDQPVKTIADVREKIKSAITRSRAGDTTVRLSYRLPTAAAETTAVETATWTIPASEATQVAALAWDSPLQPGLFAPEQFRWRASSIGEALQMGIGETHRTMALTYLTFARLFQGTVKVEHLKGPVGIAHTGMVVADRGPVWLLFFLALVSVNLAVINFLPIPITDGGHMLFLIYEQITGKAVPIVVQNVATIAGMFVIGSLFLYVTFNDISGVVRSLSAFFGG
jgi:regulator of sigma E protease